MQRLRGRVYLKDGAITAAELASDGRHIQPEDDRCWHLLTVDTAGDVLGCTRILQHTRGARFDDLRISRTALAGSHPWGERLRTLVEEDLRNSSRAGLSYVEIGGWALSEKIRRTAECLKSVLAVYAWSRLNGGAIGVSTATERNGSASILRRLGGHPMRWKDSEIPAYYDPHYGCRMHVLRYDSRMPAARYGKTIESLQNSLADVPVISPDRSDRHAVFAGFASYGFKGTSETVSGSGIVAQVAA